MTCPRCKHPFTVPMEEKELLREHDIELAAQDLHHRRLVGGLCPDCGHRLVSGGGCRICVECGWQRCGG